MLNIIVAGINAAKKNILIPIGINNILKIVEPRLLSFEYFSGSFNKRIGIITRNISKE